MTKAPRNVWVKNFSILRAGYQMIVPAETHGLLATQRILFGKRRALCPARYFAVFRGVDLEGFYVRAGDLERFVEDIFHVIHKNPGRIERLHKRTYELNDALVAFDKKMLRMNLSKLTDRELGALYRSHIHYQRNSHQHVLTTTWFVDSYGETFSKELMGTVARLAEPLGRQNDVAQMFSMLTTQPAMSFATREEQSSLQVLATILKSVHARRAFRKGVTVKMVQQLPQNVQRAINRHFLAWRWVPFGYMGPAYDLDYYLRVWSGLVCEGVDVREELRKLRKRPSIVRVGRLNLMKELNMETSTRRIMDIAADIAFLKGYRKDCLYFGCFALEYLFKEIARRFSVPLRWLYLMTPMETEAMCCRREIPPAQEIQGRKGLCVHVVDNGRLTILTGRRAQAFLARQPREREAPVDTRELRGTCACPGSSTGVVKIVNVAEEMGKMNKGDVMVSHTTFPALLPAMKKASAIVTEDGGITCHAAIVSREFNIPCVTGIKVATRALRDGDRVDVDASKGIVRKL